MEHDRLTGIGISEAHQLAARKIERYVVARIERYMADRCETSPEYDHEGAIQEFRAATADLGFFLRWKFPPG